MEADCPLKRWNRGTYRCADGKEIICRQEAVKLDKISQRRLPVNGIQSVDKHLLVVVSGTVLKRDLTEVIRGGPAQTCTLPRTVTTVCKKAFKSTNIASVKLNDGLKTLEDSCFSYSGIRRLVLSASVRKISQYAFSECWYLQCADLRAARGLRYLDDYAFSCCRNLKRVLLNEGLRTICPGCFTESGVQEIAFPRTLRRIEGGAFMHCKRLGQVCLADTALESVGTSAFSFSGFESFIAPPSLGTIGQYAFSNCKSLKHVDLSGMQGGR